MKNLKNKYLKSIVFILITLFAYLSFQKNYFNFSENYQDPNFFSYFQRDSLGLVIGGIAADKLGFDRKGSGLGFLDNKGSANLNNFFVYGLLGGNRSVETLGFIPYRSQLGLQGWAFAKLSGLFGIAKFSQFNWPQIRALESIASLALAMTIAVLFFLYRKIYDNRFAIIFLLVMLTSPWILAFARNLYWVPFLWFLPALLAAFLYLRKGMISSILLILGIGGTIFLKSLCGYEYLSTISLFTCSIFVVAPFFGTSERNFLANFKLFCLVFFVCVLGFICAVLVHAYVQGNFVEGIESVIARANSRTLANPMAYGADPYLQTALKSSVWQVVGTYIWKWHTPIFANFSGKLFKYLIGLSVIAVIYEFFINSVTRKRDTVLLVYFFIVPVSWFTLAKGHSYIHTHINYVLWYFGCVQTLIYISLNTGEIFLRKLFKFLRKAMKKHIYSI